MIIHTEGYMDQQDWWSDPANPYCFTYDDLDKYYPKEYIKSAEMPQEVIDAYCKYVPRYYKNLTGKDLESIIEFGSAGGWFLYEFQEQFFNVLGFEGTLAGCEACIKRGVKGGNISRVDLREPLTTNERFDIALCSEVAEHIPPPFAGTLVRNLVNYSDVIWFSSEEPNTNRPHLHHCNEQPLKYWINLFEFFGYGCYMLPDHVHAETAERSKCMFYNKKTINGHQLV